MFDIGYDPGRDRLTIQVRGFWKPADVAALARALGQKMNRLGPDVDAIIESLDFPVQSTEIADLLAEVARTGMSRTSGRVAVVVGSTLNRLQVERTLAHPRLRVFMEMADAEQWLADRETKAA